MSTRRIMGIRALLFVLAVAYYLVGYFALNQFNAHRVHYVDVALPLDHTLPFVPLFVIPYTLVMLVIVLGFLSIPVSDLAAFRRAFLLFFLNVSICFVIFVLVPVRDVQRPALHHLHGWLGSTMAFVYWVDAPTNLFPSLHVDAALLAGLVARQHHRRAGNALVAFAALVALSTLLVKQHYVADVLSGALLALVSARLLLPRRVTAVALRHPAPS